MMMKMSLLLLIITINTDQEHKNQNYNDAVLTSAEYSGSQFKRITITLTQREIDHSHFRDI